MASIRASSSPAGNFGQYVISQHVQATSNITKFINSTHGTGMAANVEIVWECEGRVARVKAIQQLVPGDELVFDYPLV